MPYHDPHAYYASTYTTEHQETAANPADSFSADASSSGLPQACMTLSMPVESVGSRCDSVDMRARSNVDSDSGTGKEQSAEV